MGKKRMAFKPVKPQPQSGEENQEESSDESLRSIPPPSPPPQASESDEPKRTKEGHHSSHGGRKARLTAAKRPSEYEDTDGNDVKKMKIGMEEGRHSSNEGRKTRLTSVKRPSEDADVKKVNTETKSNNSPRVWSEEDEIVVLNGILDYWNEKGTGPNEDWNAFSEFMRGKVDLDFTKVQLQDKIRWLKKKFIDNKGKKGKNKNNKERVFSTPHEQSLFDLSTQIWGNATSKPDGNASEFEEIKDGDNADVEKPNRKANASVVEEIKDGVNATGVKLNKKVTASVFGEVDGGNGGKWKELNPSAGIEETMLLYGKKIYESVHGNEEKTEWHKLRVEEMELYLKQLEVRVMQTKHILSVMKREDHKGGDEHA